MRISVPVARRLVLGPALLGSLLAAPAAAQPMQADVVDTAIAAGQFTTLATALQVTGAVDTLNGPGPFTVFAPTDAAFAKLPTGTVQALLNDPEKLRTVLAYHVVSGADTAADVSQLQQATTVEGENVTIDTSDGMIRINDATVTQADIVASNGIIHVIDTVLMPPSLAAMPAAEQHASAAN